MMANSIAMAAIAGPLAGFQSALSPVGPGAQRAAELWLGILGLSIVVFVLVWAFLLRAMARGRRLQEPPPVKHDTEAADRVARKVVTGAVAVTIVILFVILVESVVSGKSATQSLASKNPVAIQVIGHQWWWEVVYPNPDASKTIVTANEIHLPVGVPIVMNTASRDVIHSFWAPNIQGKRDLIPGYTSAFWFEIDKPGIYRGQCAEFCGLQHAKMSFYIVAEPLDQYQQWQGQQLADAHQPANDMEKRGQQVFLTHACVMCHTIRGTIAGSRVGPDLTHLAGRHSIAAATIPNSPGNLGAWIVDSQHIKPGNKMPPNPMSGDDLTALLAYLENLN